MGKRTALTDDEPATKRPRSAPLANAVGKARAVSQSEQHAKPTSHRPSSQHGQGRPVPHPKHLSSSGKRSAPATESRKPFSNNVSSDRKEQPFSSRAPKTSQPVKEEEEDEDEELSEDMEGESGDDDASQSQEEEDDLDLDGPTFGELEQKRVDGTGNVGAAARKAAELAERRQRKHAADFKRENRHRPSEVSSKKPVGRFREVIQVPSRTARDPRFADPSEAAASKPGADAASQKRYSFVYSELLPGEQKQLKMKLKRERNPEAKELIQTELTRVSQVLKSHESRSKATDVKTQWKTTERAAVAQGKAPFYLKKSESRRLELLARFKELSGKGQLDNFMEKRRKQNASKDHRYMPSARLE